MKQQRVGVRARKDKILYQGAKIRFEVWILKKDEWNATEPVCMSTLKAEFV